MKVFFSLIIFSFMLATCQGPCFGVPYKPFEIGNPVRPNTCLDIFSGRRHLIGSTWDTVECFRCFCSKHKLSCCTRYDGIQYIEECEAVLNFVTCKHEYYRRDDPSQRCDAVSFDMDEPE